MTMKALPQPLLVAGSTRVMLFVIVWCTSIIEFDSLRET